LVGVEPVWHLQLRRAVGRAAPQVLPQRQVLEPDLVADHEPNLAVTAWPCAGRSSALASATTLPATARSASSVYSTTWMPRRNVCTDRPEECRAQPPVGSAWLEPAQ